MSEIPRGFVYIPIGDDRSGCFRRAAVNAVCPAGERTTFQVGDQHYWTPMTVENFLYLLAKCEKQDEDHHERPPTFRLPG